MITDKNRFLKNTYNVMVKESRILVPRVFVQRSNSFFKKKKKSCRILLKIITLSLPHIFSQVFDSFGMYSRFIVN